LLGKTALQASEIDGLVHIKKGKAHSGEMVMVKITQAGPLTSRGRSKGGLERMSVCHLTVST
jgi:hypothetical protein